MAKLYELTEQYRLLAEKLEDADIDTQTMLDTLEASSEMLSIEEKAFNIVKMTRNWESDAAGLDAEIKRLTEKKKAIENRVQGVRQYLQMQLESCGVSKLKTPLYSLSIQNNPPAVSIVEQELIPSSYLVIRYDIDKKAIGDALRGGAMIPGAKLTQGKSLRIR